MTSRGATLARTVVVLTVALACSGGVPARAAAPAHDSARYVPVARDSLDPGALLLGRAAMEQSAGHPLGVIENLEGRDYASPSGFAGRDRAAFLLGQAYLRLGSLARFHALAHDLSGWPAQTPYTQWLAYQSLLLETEVQGAPGMTSDSLAATTDAADEASAALAAGLLIERGKTEAALTLVDQAAKRSPGSPLLSYLRMLAVERGGGDPQAELESLANSDSTTALGRDLAGGALIRLATRALERGQDPTALLERVPAGSRYQPVARHMLGLATMEHGDAERGAAILDSLSSDSAYAARREVGLALAARSLDQGRWSLAESLYVRIGDDWSAEHDALQRVLDARSFGALWAGWSAALADSLGLVLDALPSRRLAERLAASAADLSAAPEATTPALGNAPPDTSGLHVPPPSSAERASVAAAEQRAGEAASRYEMNRAAMTHEAAALVDRRRYLGIGQGRLTGETVDLGRWTTSLDSLRQRLAAIDERIRSVRDAAIAHVTARSGRIGSRGGQNDLWVRGMRFAYLDGPDFARMVWAPAGFPGPDSVLNAEDSLAQAIRRVAERVAAETPERIANSYRKTWRPGLIDRAAAEDSLATRSRAWAGKLSRSVDSSLALAWTSPRLHALDAEGLRLAGRRDSLRGAAANERDAVAAAAVTRALAALDDQREAIDYGLAASSYALSVHLGEADTAASRVRVTTGLASTAPGDSAAVADDLEDAESQKWRALAVPRIESFLKQHPQSPARAEMRFRLADLELVEARQQFHARMAAFLAAQAAGKADGMPVPVLSHASSLDLYRRILAEDPDFPHRDAVMFNAGMILADEGDPEAAKFFKDLVTAYPQSAYAQESYLRMGDMEFDEKRFLGSVALYGHAAEGSDPTLRAIADYKMGWAHFNEDRFPEAADAFRAVLDLYAANPPGTIQVDIESEANSYLIYSLAGAGGPDAFAQYFDKTGSRPYEKRLLLSLGQHFRHYGQFAKAIETDELFMRRYPNDPEVLVSAERLVDTYRRSDHTQAESEARLRYAPRFAPGGDWYAAQSNDSARAAGAEFAHASWRAVAMQHHLAARQTGSAEDWREALRLYDLLLATWPSDSDVAAIQLDAGEASAQLGDFPAALRHYGAAASVGRDSTVDQALWQRLAVTDRWYESTRKPGTGAARSGLGSDSLAHGVIDAGDALLAHDPNHAKAADVVWRQSQLGLAHGWFERASQDLERMTEKFPDDPRAPLAASQRGDALFKQGDYEAAGQAFEAALASAKHAGRDSLARRAALAVPVCYYRQAEAAVASDSTAYAKHAALFERVATRFPDFEHADLADYRAALAYEKAKRPREAIRVMEALIQSFPRSDYRRDAHLAVAKLHEAAGDEEQAADAYTDFATHYPADHDARTAWLKAGDLLAAAGLAERAEKARLDYIHRYPDDFEAAMEILAPLARRDLDGVSAERPLSSLLDPPAPKKGAKPVKPQPPANTRVAEYLRLARAHPTLASHAIFAQIQFLLGEEAYARYSSARLSQPLAKSIVAKQKLLDSTLVRYRRSINQGDPEWSHASGYRMGQALVAFGDALVQSPPPADLTGDDLKGYEDILAEQSRAFSDRGETVWTDLLRQQKPDAKSDAWLDQARTSLWQRLATRFFFRPETDFPLVRASEPRENDSDRARADRGRESTKTAAQKDGNP